MLRFSTCASSLSLRLLHEQSIHPCFHGPRMLQQPLFWHRLSVLPSSTAREGSKIQLRDASLTRFQRSFTDGRKMHHSANAVESLVLSSWELDGKEAPLRDDESKLSQSETEAGLGSFMPKLRVQIKNVQDGGYECRYRGMFIKRAKCSPDITEEQINTAEDEESAAEPSRKVKVISANSRTFAEVHTVRIRRRLTRKFLRHLQSKIDFLHSAAVPVILVKHLLKKRAFLSAYPEKLMAVIEVLTEIFGSQNIAFNVLKANAGILQQPLVMSSRRMLVFSQFEVDRRACIKIGTTKGMWVSDAEKYEGKLNFLKELGMDAQTRSKVLFRFPRLLSFSESRLRATVRLLESVGFSGPTLLKILEVNPSMFGSSVDKDLAVRVKLFQDWGFSASDIMRYLRQNPEGNIKHTESQYKLLRDQGLSHSDVFSIIRRQPSVFSIKTENLKAKLDFLGEVNRDISELVKSPRYLAFSLEQRIIPRFKALEAISLKKKPSLFTILSSSTSNFKSRFNIPE